MPPRKWPLPGDSPVARARTVAQGYRALSLQQRELLRECVDLFSAVDRRLISFDNPEIGAAIDHLHKKIVELEGPDALDQRFYQWGEDWHAEIRVTYEADDYITAREAAPLLNINQNTIGRLRIDGRIKGRFDKDIRGYRYKVADIWELASKLRGRNWRAQGTTDRVTDNGSSDPK